MVEFDKKSCFQEATVLQKAEIKIETPRIAFKIRRMPVQCEHFNDTFDGNLE